MKESWRVIRSEKRKELPKKLDVDVIDGQRYIGNGIRVNEKFLNLNYRPKNG